MRPRYVELLGDALKIEPSPTDYLGDIDVELLRLSYIRSWAFEAQLRDHLRQEFGNAWFARREAGSLLRELWGEGQRWPAEDFLRDITGSTLELESVAERVREHFVTSTNARKSSSSPSSWPLSSLDEFGFRHLRHRIGGARIGAASIWPSGAPIWPYHYHHGIEEWLYVIAGAPVLREPAGERTLAPGDLVCFPSGHRGAHTVKGPGRFVIFATGQHVEPWMSVYPDSDKVSGPEGMLLRSSAVGYWHGEGTAGAVGSGRATARAGAGAAAADRERAGRRARRRLGALLGAERLDGDGGGPGARRGIGAVPLRPRARGMAAGPGRNAYAAPRGW